MITKEGIEKMMQTPGNVRGGIFRADADFVQEKEGKNGLKIVEEKMAELGHPVNFQDIKLGEWYPEAMSVLTILVARELFNWNDQDIFQMGNSIPTTSFIAKIFMKYFLSLTRFIEEVPKYWRKHFDFGELEVSEFNQEKKYIILKEKGYKFHPLMCIYHAGYYQRVAHFAIKSPKITVEEIKCIFKGDPYHEYIIKWE